MTIIKFYYLFLVLCVFQNLIKGIFNNQFLFLGYWLGLSLMIILILLFFIKGKIYFYWFDKVVLIFVFIQFLIAIPNFFEIPKAATLGLLYNVRFIIPYFLARWLIRQESTAKKVIELSLYLILIIAGYGIYQVFFDWEKLLGYLPLKSIGLVLAHSGKFRRAYSFILSPLETGYLCLVGGGVIIGFFGFGIKKKNWGIKFPIPILLVILFCLYLTYTRSAWIGFLICILTQFFIWAVKKKSLVKLAKFVFNIAVFGLFLFLILPQKKATLNFVAETLQKTEGSTSMHYDNFIGVFKVMEENPFGLGVGRSGYVVGARRMVEGYYSEGSFFQALIEGGILGVIMVIILWGSLIFFFFREYFRKMSSSFNFFFLSMAGISAGLFSGSFFLPVFLMTNVMIFFWTFVGIGMNLSIMDKNG